MGRLHCDLLRQIEFILEGEELAKVRRKPGLCFLSRRSGYQMKSDGLSELLKLPIDFRFVSSQIRISLSSLTFLGGGAGGKSDPASWREI
jgi:hypothetical protein